MENCKSQNGKNFVNAIIAYLNSKAVDNVSFVPSTYGDQNDIPFCNALENIIDTVSISEEKPGSICISICREDGYMAYMDFDGTEDEDFDYLFHEVYYYINEANDPEADEWLEEFNKKPFDALKEVLICKMRHILNIIQYDVRVPKTWTDDMGFEYDTVSLISQKHNMIGLIDGSNGQNNPTFCTLNNLSTEDLLVDYLFLLKEESSNLQYEYEQKNTLRLNVWAEYAIYNMKETTWVLEKMDTYKQSRTHKGNIPCCPFCGSKNVSEDIHSEVPYECHECERLFDEEDIQREHLRHGISALLNGTSEKQPRHTYITILEYDPESVGLSTLELPVIDMLFEIEGDGTIWYHIMGYNKPDGTPEWKDIDTLSIEDLKKVYETLLSE